MFISLIKLFCAISLIIFCQQGVAQNAVLPWEQIQISSPVYDEVGLLSAQEKSTLEARLYRWSNEKNLQLQIAIVKSLSDVSIEEFSIKLAEKYKWGKAGTDRGVLFLLSTGERKMRIEVGKGLEGDITDAHIARIIRELRPLLRNQDYFAALVLLGNRIYELAQAEAPADELVVAGNSQTVNYKNNITFESLFLFLFFCLFIIASLLQRLFGVNRYYSKRSPRGFSGGWWPGGGGGWSGGGGGGWSGGGGGGWSGGGGGFSGGGASGDW